MKSRKNSLMEEIKHVHVHVHVHAMTVICVQIDSCMYSTQYLVGTH